MGFHIILLLLIHIMIHYLHNLEVFICPLIMASNIFDQILLFIYIVQFVGLFYGLFYWLQFIDCNLLVANLLVTNLLVVNLLVVIYWLQFIGCNLLVTNYWL